MKANYLITPIGNFKHEQGMQVIDTNAIKRIIEKLKIDRHNITIDFAHESFSKTDFSKAGELLIDSIQIHKDGLWGNIIWSNKTKEMMMSGKFRYLSPVFKYDPKKSKNGKLFIKSLVSLGLTNHPNIPAMKPVLNQIYMEEYMENFLTKLKGVLKLPDNASMEEISAKLFSSIDELNALRKKDAVQQSKLSKPADTASSKNPATTIDATPANLAQNSGLPTIEEWNALQNELALFKQREVENKVNSAIASGKLIPAQKDWAMGYANSDSAGFDGFLANSIATVRMGGMINSSSKPASTTGHLSEMQEKINSLLGISIETFNKFNK